MVEVFSDEKMKWENDIQVLGCLEIVVVGCRWGLAAKGICSCGMRCVKKP